MNAPGVLGTVPAKLYINGAWSESSNGERHPVTNPADASTLGDVAWATTADVDRAVAAARAAADDGRWSGLSGRERSRVLNRAAALLRERTEQFAQAESADVGKPILFARIVDVPTAIEQLEYFAALAQTMDGAVRETPLPALSYVRREPHGVVGLITPFNFPLILSVSKIAPALAAGNTIVHKPAEDTPLTALLTAQLLEDAGVPAGVINVVTGDGAALGNHLVAHPDVDAFAFTGSTAVGKRVAAIAGGNLKPIMTELGGNAANIVFADADLNVAVDAVINAFIFNTGQFCMAGPRLLVERPIHDALLGILSNAVPNIPVGRPSDPGTVIGPLISARQRERVEGFVNQAVADGGKIITGGSRLDLDGGYYFRPTIITGLGNDALTVREEVFGPVLTVQVFDTEEEAIQLANSTRYGLAAGVQTGSIARAVRVTKRLKAGIQWVNGWAMLDPSVPFGGYGDSGLGRESGPEALLNYTRTKSVTIAVPPA
ncbi:MAG: aldehyde dehydrogenase family protein [Nevskiaceae bacterium]|jgi:acyl-CoA reductase-like NAD-dependent aldehyde dehydrogenase|nr:aldehyde dehydrogenase family protein [Nevskiaceae bacterium]